MKKWRELCTLGSGRRAGGVLGVEPRPGKGVPRGALVRLAVLAVLVAAPTAGDVGSCSQPIEELDAAKFFAEKDRVDCEWCSDCGFVTQTCERACSERLSAESFPAGCFPLAHDGEVCLGALRAADCDEYGAYIADQGAQTPTECDFCPSQQRPEGR